MSLKHAILVLLEQEPGSGYDLVQRFNQGIGQFWNASHQQVYQQLKKLHDNKLVDFQTQRQSDKPDKKIYRISANGKTELRDWMSESNNPPVVRDALLIRIFAGHLTDKQTLLDELARHRQLHQNMLEARQAEEARYLNSSKNQQMKMRLPYLTLRRGIRYEREWIAWLDETMMFIESHSLPQSPA